MSTQTRATAYALGAILLWSTVSTAFKLSLRFLEPLELLTWSSLASLTILGVFCLVGRQRILPKSAQDWLSSLILGFLNPFLYYNILFEAYDRLRAQEAQALNYTWAIMLVLLSAPLLRQKLRSSDLISVGIGFCGAMVIAVQGDFRSFHPTDSLGVGLALGSAVVWALYWIANLRDQRTALPKLTLNFLFGFGFSLAWLAIRHGLRLPPWQGIAGAIYVGCFEMGLTFLLWMQALRYSVNTARVSVMIYITPFLSLAIISRVLGETISPATLGGLGMIIIGILWRQISTRNSLRRSD